MLFLCTSRFDLKVQEAKELERFFSFDKIEALREEKDEKPDNIEIEQISDTEEQGDASRDPIDVDDSDVDDGHDAEPQLPSSNTQPRTLGRKRKHIEDDIYQHY